MKVGITDLNPEDFMALRNLSNDAIAYHYNCIFVHSEEWYFQANYTLVLPKNDVFSIVRQTKESVEFLVKIRNKKYTWICKKSSASDYLTILMEGTPKNILDLFKTLILKHTKFHMVRESLHKTTKRYENVEINEDQVTFHRNHSFIKFV